MHTASATMEDLLESPNRASPHQKDAHGKYHAVKYRKGYYEAAPGGGINASLRDMEHFLMLQLGHKGDFLPKEIMDLVHTPHMHAKDVFEKNPRNINRFRSSFYGIGWRILDYEGHKIVFHGGWVKGFINIILFIPEKDIGIVVLQNAETSLPWVVAMTFADTVLGVEGRIWEKPSGAKKVLALTRPTKALKHMQQQRKLMKTSRKLISKAPLRPSRKNSKKVKQV
jgi:beta-lactamase class C